jgi:hypothetical protein
LGLILVLVRPAPLVRPRHANLNHRNISSSNLTLSYVILSSLYGGCIVPETFNAPLNLKESITGCCPHKSPLVKPFDLARSTIDPYCCKTVSRWIHPVSVASGQTSVMNAAREWECSFADDAR